MSNNRKAIGKHYEILALDYLKNQGLSFVEQNFTTKFGEIDLIMRDNDTHVFVEVKYRSMDQFGYAAEFVNKSKAQKLIRTAYVWLNKQKLTPQSASFRFDVIAIHQSGNSINWIKNAITQDY